MTRDDVIEALRSVEDPELGMDIVELGLLYDAEVNGPRVKVLYSLTSMGCPAGPLIQQNIEEVVRALPEVEEVETELTWDPPWTPDKMSEDAKFILGFGQLGLLREVVEPELDAFVEFQREPEANEMAVFPARDRESFYAHWRRLLADDSLIQRTIVD